MDALALGGFRSRIAGVLGVRGSQGKADVNSLEGNAQSTVRATAYLGESQEKKGTPCLSTKRPDRHGPGHRVGVG